MGTNAAESSYLLQLQRFIQIINSNSLVFHSMRLYWLFFFLLLSVIFQTLVHAASLPLEKIKLPPGFTIGIWAEIPGARAMTSSDDGTVFVISKSAGNLYAITQNDDKRQSRIIASNLKKPVGAAFLNGALYVATPGHILRFRDIERNLEDPVVPEVISVELLSQSNQNPGYLAAGPDGRLYLSIISPCNVCEANLDQFALIASLKPDGSDLEIVARGVRHAAGLDWHPTQKTLWFTDISRNWMGDHLPPDELNHAPRKAMHFGFPYCHGSNVLDPKFGAKRGCEKSTPPALDLDPHVAPTGIRFYTGDLFPKQYHQQIFLAESGSWNRREKVGYQIKSITVDGNGQIVGKQTFASGWLEDNQVWGRPIDLLVLPDGSMLVSDDIAGVIYQIRYQKPE